MNDAAKLARSQEKIAMINAARDILTHPGIIALTGFILVEYLQSHQAAAGERDNNNRLISSPRRIAGGGWLGSAAGTTIEAALAAYLLAPSGVEMAKQIKPMAESVAPLLLAAGKAAI